MVRGGLPGSSAWQPGPRRCSRPSPIRAAQRRPAARWLPIARCPAPQPSRCSRPSRCPSGLVARLVAVGVQAADRLRGRADCVIGAARHLIWTDAIDEPPAADAPIAAIAKTAFPLADAIALPERRRVAPSTPGRGLSRSTSSGSRTDDSPLRDVDTTHYALSPTTSTSPSGAASARPSPTTPPRAAPSPSTAAWNGANGTPSPLKRPAGLRDRTADDRSGTDEPFRPVGGWTSAGIEPGAGVDPAQDLHPSGAGRAGIGPALAPLSPGRWGQRVRGRERG